MNEFNRHIVGPIQVVAAYFGSSYQGIVEAGKVLKGIPAAEQLSIVMEWWKKGELNSVLKTDAIAVQVNYPYWKRNNQSDDVLQALKESWLTVFPNRLLAD
jgi:hypothetical protein